MRRSSPALRLVKTPRVDIAVSGARCAERLIGLGFRYWVAGYKSGDIDRWEDAWCIYAQALGPNAARTAVDTPAEAVGFLVSGAALRFMARRLTAPRLEDEGRRRDRRVVPDRR